MTGKSKVDMYLVVFPRILNPISFLKNTTYNVYLEINLLTYDQPWEVTHAFL